MDVLVTRRVRNLVSRTGTRFSGGSGGGGGSVSPTDVPPEVVPTPTALDQLTFGLTLNFGVSRTYMWVCPDDLFIREIICEEGTATIQYVIDDELVNYELGGLLSQFCKIYITPTNTGITLLIGEFKL